MSRKKLSEEQIRQKIYQSFGDDVELIGPYLGSMKKTLFKCGVGHVWSATPSGLTRKYNKKGCPECGLKSKTLSTEEVNRRIKDKGIEIISEHYGIFKQSVFKCSYGHIWSAMSSNVLYGSSCPSCSIYGFDQNEVAYGYLICFDDFVKFGITNHLEQRLKKHSKSGKFVVIATKKFNNGLDALKWEQTIKRDFPCSHVDKEQLQDGYTETLSMSLLEQVKNTLTKNS